MSGCVGDVREDIIRVVCCIPLDDRLGCASRRALSIKMDVDRNVCMWYILVCLR
jgi:hypothetical protein